jgi:hypothetical protein
MLVLSPRPIPDLARFGRRSPWGLQVSLPYLLHAITLPRGAVSIYPFFSAARSAKLSTHRRRRRKARKSLQALPRRNN